MSLPDWVIKFKEPLTEIKCIHGTYYKYKVKHVYDSLKKRSIKKDICLLGKITEDRGFVPSPKNTLREEAKRTNVDIKTFGIFAIFEELLREEILSLQSVLGEDLANKILSFSMIRWAYQSPIKRAENYHSHDFCSEFWSSEHALSDKALSAALKNVGENREKILSWMRSFFPNSNAEHFILMDSTHIVSQSENLAINAPGYNPDLNFDKQIRLMYMFSAELKQPVYYRLLNGNLSDVSTLALCVKELALQDVIFIADKGFYSADNVEFLSSNHFQYIIPIKRNNSVIDYSHLINGNLKKKCDYFQYQNRAVWYYQYEKDGKNLITFLNDRLRVEEEDSYLARIKTHPEEYTKEDFLKKLHTFGTFTIAYNVDKKLTAQQIYEIYKKRNEIEIMFDSYKNFLKADQMYMQNRYVLEGWLFCNFIAMIAYYKLFEKLRAAGLLAKISPKDIIELGKSIHKIKVNGEWVTTEIPQKNRNIFKKINICSLK